jgi:hypothetical protein
MSIFRRFGVLSENDNETDRALHLGVRRRECGGGAAAALFEHQTHGGVPYLILIRSNAWLMLALRLASADQLLRAAGSRDASAFAFCGRSDT